MSTKKQVKTGTTQYWWGFVLQFDFKQDLSAGNILQTFVVLKDQNEEFANDYLNFMCQATRLSSGDDLFVISRDCGTNDLADEEFTVKSANSVIGNADNYSNRDLCPN